VHQPSNTAGRKVEGEDAAAAIAKENEQKVYTPEELAAYEAELKAMTVSSLESN
jgi:hypothetical protein